jgi:hypothetical protein
MPDLSTISASPAFRDAAFIFALIAIIFAWNTIIDE